MSLATAFIAPLALLLPSPVAVSEAPRDAGVCRMSDVPPAEIQHGPFDISHAAERSAPISSERWPASFLPRSFVPQNAAQVRIERSVRIRIAPRSRAPSPNMLVGVPTREVSRNLVERRMGRCVDIDAVAAVQASGTHNLVLYLRDRRMVRAELDQSCTARDFYSGFYVSRSKDGRLCVGRDVLQSRSGTNCTLTAMRQLVEAED